MKKPELLLPAGDRETLETAIHYGADAVYLGGKSFSLRAKADNFTPEEMADAVSYAHGKGVKVYVTANILAHDDDLAGAPEFLRELSEIKPDGILTADPGLFRLAGRYCPDIDLHISTQANNTNSETVLFWRDLGAKRVVLARELSLEEIRTIREAVPEDMELEVFIHGAMCMSYSGRCLLSNYLTGRDANRGACTHPCRWNYALMEESRPGVYLPVEEDGYGTAIMSSEDLCMIDHVPELIGAGIDSLKIEGRMKTALYVATVARAYREAIDAALTDRVDGDTRVESGDDDPYDTYRKALPRLIGELDRCTHRPYGTGFFFGKPGSGAGYKVSTAPKAAGESVKEPTKEGSSADTPDSYVRGAVYLGRVLETPDEGTIIIRQYNKFIVGDSIEILLPDGSDLSAVVTVIRDRQTGTEQESAPHPRQELAVSLSWEHPPVTDITGCVIRKL